MEDYQTSYWDKDGHEHEAIQVPWKMVEMLLEHPHEGTPEDDQTLMDHFGDRLPGWAKDAEGWIDEYGWGLIGPEKPETET